MSQPPGGDHDRQRLLVEAYLAMAEHTTDRRVFADQLGAR